MGLSWYLESTFHQTDHTNSFLSTREMRDERWEVLLDSPDWTGYCRGSTGWWSWSGELGRREISDRDRDSRSSGRHLPSPPPSGDDWGGRGGFPAPGPSVTSPHLRPSIPRILGIVRARALSWRQIYYIVVHSRVSQQLSLNIIISYYLSDLIIISFKCKKKESRKRKCTFLFYFIIFPIIEQQFSSFATTNPFSKFSTSNHTPSYCHCI